MSFLDYLALNTWHSLPHGLTATYYSNTSWEGEPHTISTENLRSRDLLKNLPADLRGTAFSVEWTGHVEIRAAGTYRFSIAPQRGNGLFIDGVPVIRDRGGPRAPGKRSGAIFLEKGLHDLTVHCARHDGSGSSFEVSWVAGKRPRKTMRPLGSLNLLSPGLRPETFRTFRLGRDALPFLIALWCLVGFSIVAPRLRPPSSLTDLLGAAAVSLTTAAIFFPVTFQMTVVNSSFNLHLWYARIFFESNQIKVSHFLFHALTAQLHRLLPVIDMNTCGTLVVVASHIATSLIIFALLRSALGLPGSFRTSCIAGLSTIAVMIVGPIALFRWIGLDHHLYLGYVNSGITYSNATIPLLRPMSLLLFLSAVRIYLPKTGRSPVATIIFSATLVVVSSLAKPSFLICLLPSLGLLSLYVFVKKRPIDWPLLILGFMLPGILVLAWQYLMTFGMPGLTTTSSRIIFAPFLVASTRGSWLAIKLLLSALFPLCVLVTFYREATKTLSLKLAWLLFLSGISFFYLFAQAEPHLIAGDFGWSAQITLFVLFVASLIFLLERGARPARSHRLRLVVCWLVFALHVISGIVLYAMYSTVAPEKGGFAAFL